MSPTGVREAADGTRLVTHRWPASRARAAMVMVHGLGDHLGRHDHVGATLAESGIDVRGTDLRGFGASGGARAFADSYDTLLDDLAVDVEEALGLGVPVILLGHSLGGLQALIYATSERPRPHLLVLSAPALRNTLPGIKTATVRVMGRIAPRMTIANPVDAAELSRDQTVGERYEADPLVLQRSTFGLGSAVLDALGRVPGALKELDLPTLVIHGSADRIVSPRISAPLADLPSVERRVLDGFRHESFNEDGGDLAIQTVLDWVDRQLAPA